jgi:hypothetical protein
MKQVPILCAMLALAVSVHGADTAWSQPAAIDLTGGATRRVAPVSVAYAPYFVPGGDPTFGKVELLDIRHYGTFSPTTNTLVSTSAASVVGAATLTGAGAHHLVLRAFDANDALVGEISADVGLGVDSGFTAETLADMEDGKLDRAVAAGGVDVRPALAYSDKWVARAASLAIDHDAGAGVFNTIFSANAPADGTYSFHPTAVKRTTGTVRLHFYDVGGNEIGEPLLASYAGVGDMATVLFMR